MAGSKYAYVKSFELPDPILPNTFIILRIDGHSFHRFSDVHDFIKPNDERALQLMDHAATDVMKEYSDIVLAFGESDEYSFLLRRNTSLYNRRHAKILSTLISHFTSSYVFHWRQYFPDTEMKYPPSFDGRVILYPTEKEVRDYFAWRQVDTHINNLYNTAFWALVHHGNLSPKSAHETLRGTASGAKHEILFSRFGINYNDLSLRFRKGSVLMRQDAKLAKEESAVKLEGVSGEEPAENVTVVTADPRLANSADEGVKAKQRKEIAVVHVDMISDKFWELHPDLLCG